MLIDLSLRRLAFTAALMVLTIAATVMLCPVAVLAKEVPRLRTDDPAAIKNVRDQIAKDKGFSVVFVGDSAIYSSASRLDKETLPSYFSDLAIGKVNVYDLSLPGGSFVNSYEILKFVLPARPDMVVFDINIGWFGSTKIEHAVLSNLNASRKNNQLKSVKIGDFPADLYVPWTQKDFSSLSKAEFKFGTYVAGMHNPQWAAFNNSLYLLKQSKAKAVLYLPPRNEEMYRKYNLVDDQFLYDKVGQLKAVAEAPNVMFFDYTWRISSDHFSDSIHLFPAGSHQLAELLVNDIGLISK